jgi:hypothetical protein
MTFTYGGKLNTVPRDWVRFLIGDTDIDDESNQLLTDEELTALIGSETNQNSLYGIAADAADAIATKFRKYPPTRIGLLANIRPQEIVVQYERLANQLRNKVAGDVRIYAGGTEKVKAFQIEAWDYENLTSSEEE